ncbi:hypothetical protein D3C73_1464130 [compost metagenome]
MGDNNHLSISPINSSIVKLKIERINGVYHFGYAEIADQTKEAYTTTSIDEIHSLGFGCKTWDNPCLLQLDFSNIQLKSSDEILI